MAPYHLASLEALQDVEKRYFAAPHSLESLTPIYKTGLIPITVFAMMSLVSVTALLGFITHRLISWRRHYKEYVGYNQYVILIYNLLLADLQQSIAFSISFHWLKIDAILAPTAPCFVQGWFLNLGDVASGFFVLVIAIHTWLGVVKGYKMPYRWFVLSIIGIWVAAVLLTALGPAIHKDRFFTRAGGWCWISSKFQGERLWLHYLWIFIVQFGTIAIYGHVFIHLRGRIRSIMTKDTAKLTRATKFMVLYPIAYLALTFPIAVGRMIVMAGRPLPDTFFAVAGALLTSCGWIDVLLYTLTRRVFVNNGLSSAGGQYNRTVNATVTNVARPGDAQIYGLSSITSKEPVSSNMRTVSIVGGSDRISRLVDQRSRRNSLRSKHHDSLAEDSPTRTGSQDSMIKSIRTEGINIVTETNIQVEAAGEDRASFAPGQRSRPRCDTEHSRRS